MFIKVRHWDIAVPVDGTHELRRTRLLSIDSWYLSFSPLRKYYENLKFSAVCVWVLVCHTQNVYFYTHICVVFVFSCGHFLTHCVQSIEFLYFLIHMSLLCRVFIFSVWLVATHRTPSHVVQTLRINCKSCVCCLDIMCNLALQQPTYI